MFLLNLFGKRLESEVARQFLYSAKLKIGIGNRNEGLGVSVKISKAFYLRRDGLMLDILFDIIGRLM